MTFHTVPEIYYNNGWHLYDADHKVYYLAEDNKTVAILAEIIAATAELSSAALGQYSYFVMLGLYGSVRDAARVAAVHLTSEVQVAKTLFPNVVPGTVNHLIYQDWSSASDQHDVKVSVAVQ